jgi:hypothetical protein
VAAVPIATVLFFNKPERLQWIITNRKYIEYPAEVSPSGKLPTGEELSKAVQLETRKR